MMNFKGRKFVRAFKSSQDAEAGSTDVRTNGGSGSALPDLVDLRPFPAPKDLTLPIRQPDHDPSSTSATAPTPSTPSETLETPRGNSGAGTSDDDAYFRPARLSRAGSVYSISRVSFQSQISQLTAIQMPQASSLANSISSLSNSFVAARALRDAAVQLQKWTSKASDILSGLDAQDDVEWAAAAGRDGLGEVDEAITRFEGLIQVYIGAVEDLQARSDISQVAKPDMLHLVDQIDNISKQWQGVKESLSVIKSQVELAMEWEELWNNVLGDIGQETEALSNLVFEMEERRHHINFNAHHVNFQDESGGFDIGELESIVDSPAAHVGMSALHSSFGASTAPTTSQDSPLASPGIAEKEDTNLLGLFARMQPLRASLEFLPMRLAAFHNRAKSVLPTACDELQRQRLTLEKQFKQLETEAETLRRELGEDRWVLVFKNAGKQALKMMDSVHRSITKLDEALDSNTDHNHAPATSKKIDNYEAKKTHYAPAIERVIAIVEKGVKDRLTVNGEIVRLQTDLRQKWQTLSADIRNMDSILTHFGGSHKIHNQTSRGSFSTILSSDRSFISSGATDTPGSSPASSVYLPSRHSSDETRSQQHTDQQHNGASPVMTLTPLPSKVVRRRNSYLPVPSPTMGIYRTPARNVSGSHHSPASSAMPSNSSSTSPKTGLSARGPASRQTSTSTTASTSATPTSARQPLPMTTRTPTSSEPARPRWNVSTNTSGTKIGHTARPLATTTPSPYRKTSTPPQSSSSRFSSVGQPSPLSRRTSSNFTTSPHSQSQSHSPNTSSWRPPSRAALGPGPYSQAVTASSTQRSPASGRTSRRASSLAPSPRAPLSTSQHRNASLSFNGDGNASSAVGGSDDALWTPPLSPQPTAAGTSHSSSRPQSSMSTSTSTTGKRASTLSQPHPHSQPLHPHNRLSLSPGQATTPSSVTRSNFVPHA